MQIQGSAGFATFTPNIQFQRAGLALTGGRVYVSFAGVCEQEHPDSFAMAHGFVMAYDSTSYAQVGIYATTPGPMAKDGNVWQGGAAPAADSAGRIWFATGNGTSDVTLDTNPSDTLQALSDYGDSFIKLEPPFGGLFPNGDWFTPCDQSELNTSDADLGAGGPLLLPQSVGSQAHQNLMIAAGKSGKIYLIDAYNMGQTKVVGGSTGCADPSNLAGNPPPAIGGGGEDKAFGVPAYWNGFLYFGGAFDQLRQFTISNAQITPYSVSSDPQAPGGFGNAGAIPSISANGSSNGIVWVVFSNATDRQGCTPTTCPYGFEGAPETLIAYNAANLAKLVTLSPQGGYPHFSVPTVANGRVYLPTGNSVVVYGVN